MTTFDQRDKNFENKFAHDEEISFKIHARRNKLLGLWAAEKLGKTGDSAESYAKEVVLVEFEETNNDIPARLLADFNAAGLMTVNERDIRLEMERLMPIARQQIMGSVG